MTTNIAKIRAALESALARATSGSRVAELRDAIAALAELERAAAEPVATVCLVTDRFAHNHCIEAQLQVDPSTQLPIGTKLYAAPPAPVTEIRDVVVTDDMCERAYISKWRGVPELIDHEPDDEDRQWAREWLTAWRAELGPTPGLVTREEMARSVEIRDTEIARLKTDLELARIGARRYETARRMDPRMWADACKLNLFTGKHFDEIIDELRPFMFPQDAARAGNGGGV